MAPRFLLATFVALAACSSSDASTPDASTPDAAPPDAAVPVAVTSAGWTVSAGTPVLSTDGTQVTGSVTFTRASGVDTRGGGACLIADLNGATPCTGPADCASLTVPAGGFLYCGAENGGASKICWTRPGADTTYCTKAPNRVPGTYPTPTAPAVVDGKVTRWIGVACMAIESNPMGCASTDEAMHVYAFGPSVTAKP
jgi:hypothetical protein